MWIGQLDDAPKRGRRDHGVLERLLGHDVGRAQVFVHHADDALAGFERHPAAFAIRRRDGGAAGQRHPQRLGQRVHRRRRAHRVAVADRRRRRRHHVHELVVADLALGKELAAFPDDGAGAGQAALPPAVQHRAAGQHDGGNVHRCRAHQAGRRGLVAAGGQHDAVERVAVQDFDQAEIGEVAVERGGRPLAGFLDRMHREFQRHAAGIADAVADAAGEFDMVAVARRQVGAGLGDADDRLAAAQFVRRDAVVHVALKIQRGHCGIGGVVEPAARPQPLVFAAVVAGHWRCSSGWPCGCGRRLCGQAGPLQYRLAARSSYHRAAAALARCPAAGECRRPIAEIDHQADHQPHHQPQPRDKRQAGHQQQAEQMPSTGTKARPGTRKGRCAVGVAAPQIDHRAADQDEGEQRADADTISPSTSIGTSAATTATTPRSVIWLRSACPSRGWTRANTGRQQPVLRHREEDAALAVEQHQDHRGQPGQRADLDQAARTRSDGRSRPRPWRSDRRR